MPRYYTYLISSLPLLQFGMKPPFSYGRFLQICQEKIPDEEISILKMITITGDYPFAQVKLRTLHKWRIFDTTLRNELVKMVQIVDSLLQAHAKRLEELGVKLQQGK